MRDLYEILGAPRGAGREELKAAWVTRTRVLSPDRWDPRTHCAEREQARRMLAEVNEAYAVLRDPVRRARYDADGDTPAAVASSVAGEARFSDLPDAVQRRLLERQAGRVAEQFRVRAVGVAWAWVWIVLFPICVLSLAHDGQGLGARVLLVLATLLAGYGVERIVRWTRASLKGHDFVTPLYLIRTRLDGVRFWPLRDVRRCETVVHVMYGRTVTMLMVHLPHGVEMMQLRRAADAPALTERIHAWQRALHDAEARGDQAYLDAHDDFRGFDPEGARPVVTGWDLTRIASYGGVLAAAVALAGRG